MAQHYQQELGSIPDFLKLHRLNPRRYPFLLESVAHGTAQARYDILFAFPGDTLVLNNKEQLYWKNSELADKDFLHALDQCWVDEKTGPKNSPCSNDNLPFCGGWFVFLAYELAQQVEPRLGLLSQKNRFPLAQATRIPLALILDHTCDRCFVVCESDKKEYIEQVKEDISSLLTVDDIDDSLPLVKCDEENPALYLKAVSKIKKYIEDGDVFQVNVSRSWNIRLGQAVSPATLYEKLKQTNPSPFAGLMRLNDRQAIISSSPERLLQRKGSMICTRPIAGTHPRSTDEKQDRDWSQELLRHPKERAEHVMLIDLERNDLGRVCQPGSIKIRECMALESYRHVHHIVSEVCGEPLDDITPGAILRALFPGGTITGCPKVRTMEIIAELETTPREAYTGSMGFINHNGDMDFNILIRSMTMDNNNIVLRAGAGIVADSDPERELNETRAKAKGLLACFEGL